MAFSWGGQGGEGGDNHHQGESPASSGSGGAASSAGRGFWLGGGGSSDRSEEESDGGYGLFNNSDFGGFSSGGGGAAGEGLSMDFWSIEDVKPMNLGGNDADHNSSSASNNGQYSSTQGGLSYEDPLVKARREMLLGSSPDAMETFDDLAGFGTA